jgi:hypothetical protein
MGSYAELPQKVLVFKWFDLWCIVPLNELCKKYHRKGACAIGTIMKRKDSNINTSG